MFNDRDLGILGAGALLAVLCLILPLPFVGKIILGLSVLVGFIILALLRLGPDRIPLEEWLRRRMRFHLQARRYTFQQPGSTQQARWKWRQPRFQTKDPALEKNPTTATPAPVSQPREADRPLTLALEEVGLYPLVTALLAVVGIYFLVWLAQGGVAELARLMRGIFP